MKNINKLTVAMTLALVMGYAQADNGSAEINFTGSIMADSCVISLDSQEDVNLGNISKGSISTIGNNSPRIPFEVKLDSCDAGQQVSLKLIANSEGSDESLIKTTGTAEGVGVVIWENNDPANAMVIGNTTKPIVANGSGQMAFGFDAAYQSHAEIVPGTANATANFEILYP